MQIHRSLKNSKLTVALTPQFPRLYDCSAIAQPIFTTACQ
jgi:hypothetical protein